MNTIALRSMPPLRLAFIGTTAGEGGERSELPLTARASIRSFPLRQNQVTAVFTFVEKKVAFFLHCASTAVSFLLALRVTPCVHGHDAHVGATLAVV